MNQIEFMDGSFRQLTKDQAFQVSNSIRNINLSNTKFIRFTESIEGGRVTRTVQIPMTSIAAIMLEED